MAEWAQVINKIVTWDDLAFLRSLTSLPIVLKGILHPDDARLAREHSVDGVIVSNHGGRQVDGAIAALDALPAIVDAVGGDMPVLFDSGIRCGADIVKALALGADAVLLGRPYLWGLALDGQAGVETVLRMLLAELDLTLALSGCATPAPLGAPRPCPAAPGRGGTCVRAALGHQVSLGQHPEVLGDGRSGDVEASRDLARRQLLAPHQPEDVPTVGLGQGLEGGVHVDNVSRYLRKCPLSLGALDRSGYGTASPATRRVDQNRKRGVRSRRVRMPGSAATTAGWR